ncbi:MAG: OmpA family protein [Myxococcales bacterium]|nr:OmpA family protein [Myxococcales bacterium]
MNLSLRNTLTGLALAGGLWACGPAPKPAELVSYEQMRQGDYAQTVQERHPDLFAEAQKYYRRALEAHDDGEDERTLHNTRLATMTWRTAVALSQTKDAADSLRAADARLQRATEALADADQRRKAAEDAIARQRRINEMQAKLDAANQRAAQKQQATDAKTAVEGAAAKVQLAETMGGGTHAPGPLNKAQASLKMALAAFDKADYAEAARVAGLTAADADVAIAAAKPFYEAEEKRKAYDLELKKMLEATADVPGAEARVERRGLVVSLRSLFAAGKSSLDPDVTAPLRMLATIAKDHADFRLIIEGHTDNRGRSQRNLELSEKRAQAVTNYMAGEGVANDRMTALGKGDAEPIADNSTRQGRETNRRVDIVYLRPVVPDPQAAPAPVQ